MNIVTLTPQNIEAEHICCSLSSKTTATGVAAKKEWLGCRMQDGLVFKKHDDRGKVFIEYLPAKNAWIPIVADNYMYINCFWVSGAYKGHGYGKRLLAECEADALAKGYKGVTLIVGKKKKPFLSDKVFMERQGYTICDSCDPFFELAVKRFDDKAPLPQFKDCARNGFGGEDIKGIDVFFTAQCPFTVPYTELLKPVIMATDYPVRIHQIKTKEEAQNHICPVTTYNIFVNGKFHTNEIYTPDKFKKLISSLK